MIFIFLEYILNESEDAHSHKTKTGGNIEGGRRA
jgi:hypothetical protein